MSSGKSAAGRCREVYGQTVHAQVDPSYTQYSDSRIPHMYCYDTTTGVVEDITPDGDTEH
ncbi:MAG: hypothetical protein KBT10_04220 [Bacteroidales bacterium]|nr:hypothetical protein [Candidatus Sodaliphilus aphodohippi]